MKKASLKTLVEDVKISFSFASKNVISFFLAMLGVLLVTAIILVLMILFVVIPLFFTIGLEAMINFFTQLVEPFPPADAAALLALVLFIVLPILAPIFVAFGALFGMAREIVESEGTTAEGVFVWYQKKFFSLAAGGIILFLVVIGPLAVAALWIYVYIPFPYGMPTHVEISLAFAAVMWLFVSSGMLSMIFPGIIDGHSALGAARRSVGLSWRYFDRVFSTWFAFLGIIVLPWMPLILSVFSPSYNIELVAWYVLPLALFTIFLAIPAMAIGVSRVYLILTGEEMPDTDSQEPDLNFVGGI
ncbi:MAG: hypothetical protein ACE5H4_07325 [Candidatus Thorarchaeota archaeon]